MKNKPLIIASFSLVVLLITFIFLYTPPLELYPQNQTYLEYGTATAQRERDPYSATLDTMTDHLHFSYIREGTRQISPSLIFHSHDLVRTIDISRYDYVEVTVDPDNTEDFVLSLFMYIPGFSNPALTDTHRPYAMRYRIDSAQEQYSFPIEDFATPARWFGYMDITKEGIPETDWTQMTHIMFDPFEEQRQDQETHEISLKRLRLVSTITPAVLLSLAVTLAFALCSYLLSLFFQTGIRTRRRTQKTEPRYQKVSSGYSRDDSSTLVTFIGENYGNPLMSLDFIRKRLGLNSYQVNEILKDSFDMQYKEYINTIRITEAKRLLRESNKQISDIAEQVGYCYSNSFARIFRKIENMTPNQYRKQTKGQ